MKKIITLLFAIITVFSASSFAQPGTICDAGFSFTVNGGNNTIQFVPATINTSALLQHQWFFGDGTAGSNFSSPSHVYAAAGAYYATHVVTYRSPNDSNLVQCSDSVGQMVTIAGLPACNLHSNFSFVRDSIQTNKVYFSNLSSGTDPNTIVKWYFGDGTFSYDANPVHIYQASGAYTVCLAVRNDSLCADDTCKIVQVQVPTNTCNLQVNFTSQVDSINHLLVHFYNQSAPMTSTDSIKWIFGDGSISNDLNPSHTYNQGGTYNVCLVIKRSIPGTVPCVREYCRAITLQVPPPACNIHSNFSFVRDSIQTNKVYFSNLSTGTDPNTIVKWYFGDGTFSYDTNPIHIYQASGAYTVCLAVRRDSLCADDTCKIVQVQVPSNTCNLQVYFTNMVDSSNALLVHFYNQSTPLASTDSVQWIFGDGSTSTELNPSHTYQRDSIYHVCLIIKKNTPGTVPCVREYCKSVVVQQPSTCNLVPGFTFYPDSISAVPNSYTFFNTSTPVTSIDSTFWDFGDGTPVLINPSSTILNHTFTSPGVYVICLKIKKVLPGSTTIVCERQTCQTIVVTQQPPACDLHSNFSFVRDSIQTNKVYFSNLSSGTDPNTVVKWYFGDGTFSYDANPVHIYLASGAYTVCLAVRNDSLCADDTCKIVQVQVPANTCNLQVHFTSQTDSINHLLVHFYNQSAPMAATDSVKWIFGDGSISNDLDPSHTYNQGGTYNVCLVIKRNIPGTVPCVREFCQTITVQQQPACNLVANFVFYRDTIPGTTLSTFHFENTSTPLNNVDSSFWDFGDSTPVLINPNNPITHTYTSPGVYVVCLRVKKVLAGSTIIVCERQICKTIIVTQQPPACNLQVHFTWTKDSSNSRKIYFANLTNAQPSNAVALWTFGDGTGSNNWNPDHIYTSTGQFTVCLKVTLSGTTCFSDTCQVITVTQTQPDSCNVIVSFASHADSVNSRKVYFVNTTPVTSPNVTAHWSFGDGTGANGWNVVHEYAQPGLYAVCLTVTTASNCTRVTCDSVLVQGGIVPTPNCDSIHLGYVYRRDAYMSNKLFFFATSNRPIQQQQWIFTRLSNNSSVTVNQNDPVHVFSDTGRYSVCVRASYWGGCVKEYCNEVKINRTNVPSHCMLQAYPNPAHSNVSVNVQLEQPGLITASIFTSQSILLMQHTQPGFTGNNLVTLNVQNLVPGFYTVRIMYNGRVCYTRFQKI